MIQVDFNILNQKGSPALYQDTFANRPAASLAGRIFIATNTGNLYRDTGTTWVQIATGGGPGVTPGIDDVLAVGQKFTAARDIDCDNRDFLIQNAKTFIVENQSGNAFFEQSGSIVRFGDLSNTGGKTKFILDDSNQLIKTTLNSFDSGMYFEYTQKQYLFGDYNNTNNGTSIFIDDSAKYIGTRYDATQAGFRLNYDTRVYEFGAILYGNNTTFIIDDFDRSIYTNYQGLKINHNNQYAILGDFNGISNLLTFVVDNQNQLIYSGGIGLKLDYANSAYYLGDYSASSNLWCLVVTDSAPDMGFKNINTNTYGGLYVDPSSAQLGDFSNNANGTYLSVIDGNSEIQTGYNAVNNGLFLNFVSGVYKLFGTAFNTQIVLQDNAIGGKTIQMNCNTPIQLDDNGTGNFLEVPSGGAAGLHWVVKINGTLYKIKLDNY